MPRFRIPRVAIPILLDSSRVLTAPSSLARRQGPGSSNGLGDNASGNTDGTSSSTSSGGGGSGVSTTAIVRSVQPRSEVYSLTQLPGHLIGGSSSRRIILSLSLPPNRPLSQRRSEIPSQTSQEDMDQMGRYSPPLQEQILADRRHGRRPLPRTDSHARSPG